MKRKRQRFAEHGGQARVLAIVGARLMLPLFAILALLGSFVVAEPLMALSRGQMQAHAAGMLGAGYSPSSMNVSNMPQAQVIFYDNDFVKNLKAHTPGLRCCNRRQLPEKSGNQYRLFMYQTLSANTAQSTDGVVGSGITVSVVNNTATIGEFSDYVNVSSLSLKTAIDPTLQNLQKELAYRLGLSINRLVLNTADGASTFDTKVSALSKAAAIPFGKGDVNTMVQSMAGQNVAPFETGGQRFCGIIHPFIIGDTINDVSNNSLTDVLKHTVEGQMKLEELPAPGGDKVQVMDWGGATFYASTTVTQTANYLGSGKTALRTYLFGEEGVIAISLGQKEGGQIGNGDWRNMKLYMYRTDEPDKSDPTGTIGGWTSYRVQFVSTVPPDTTGRLRYVDSVSNVS